MIEAAIEHITRQANEYLRRRFEMSEDMVVLSGIQEQDGSLSPQVFNKVVVFLVSVERDATFREAATPVEPGKGRRVLRQPPICFNLYVMVAAHFSAANYPEALKVLSKVVEFFQARPVFDRHNSPSLDRGIQRLVIDVENLSLSDQAILWGSLGGRYLPSVLYRIRMIAIDSAAVHGQVGELDTTATELVS